MKKLLLAVILLAAAVVGEVTMVRLRPVKSATFGESAFAAFGGLRSIIAEVVWFRADRLQEEGRYVELAQLARTLALMEPHTPEVWSYAAWNLAYNVSIMMPTSEDRWRWVLSALTLLRDDGLACNPESGEIHRELAWLFELKLGTTLDSASATYRAKWREIVRDVKSRGAWKELGMEENVMSEIEGLYGVADRGDPLYSAIYWAHRGLAFAKGADRSFLREIIRQSRFIYRKNHENHA